MNIILTRGEKSTVDYKEYKNISSFKWCCTLHGGKKYATRNSKGNRTIYLHRQIMDFPVGLVVDHINGDTLDNRRTNLRICTQKENIRNSKMFNTNTSGYRGVTFRKDRGKWASQIMINDKHISLGMYLDKKKAAKAYNTKSKELFGEFSFQNKV